MDDLVKRLRALVIMDEVRSDNQLGKEAADRIEALEAEAAWQREQRAAAMLRRQFNAPEDPHVAAICERYGYGAVMDAASRLWARKDSMGAFYIGGCVGLRTDEEARALTAPPHPTPSPDPQAASDTAPR